MEEKVIEIGTVSPEDVLNDIDNSKGASVSGQDMDTQGLDEKDKDEAEQKGVNIPFFFKRESEDSKKEEESRSIYDLLEEEIMKSDMPDGDKAKRLSRLLKIRSKKVNIMLTGATGSGKSSTINALFDMDVAKVGVGVDPETNTISKFSLDNLIIWDTPGLGDGVENDEKITREIIAKLNEMDADDKPLIDMVVVILDASSKDLGTSYDLINNVLIPCLGDEAKERILIALNQSDIAMKGTHWNVEKNEPDEVLKEFLKKKAASVQKRIKEGTGLDIKPICYCAGYKEEGGEQRKPYNLTKLLYYIVKAIPRDKRLALADNINNDADNWLYDDNESVIEEELKVGFVTRYGTVYRMEQNQVRKLVEKSWESLARLWEE